MDSRAGKRTVLPQAKVEKDLEVNIDDRLTFKKHIEVIRKKGKKDSWDNTKMLRKFEQGCLYAPVYKSHSKSSGICPGSMESPQ